MSLPPSGQPDRPRTLWEKVTERVKQSKFGISWQGRRPSNPSIASSRSSSESSLKNLHSDSEVSPTQSSLLDRTIIVEHQKHHLKARLRFTLSTHFHNNRPNPEQIKALLDYMELCYPKLCSPTMAESLLLAVQPNDKNALYRKDFFISQLDSMLPLMERAYNDCELASMEFIHPEIMLLNYWVDLGESDPDRETCKAAITNLLRAHMQTEENSVYKKHWYSSDSSTQTREQHKKLHSHFCNSAAINHWQSAISSLSKYNDELKTRQLEVLEREISQALFEQLCDGQQQLKAAIDTILGDVAEKHQTLSRNLNENAIRALTSERSILLYHTDRTNLRYALKHIPHIYTGKSVIKDLERLCNEQLSTQLINSLKSGNNDSRPIPSHALSAVAATFSYNYTNNEHFCQQVDLSLSLETLLAIELHLSAHSQNADRIRMKQHLTIIIKNKISLQIKLHLTSELKRVFSAKLRKAIQNYPVQYKESLLKGELKLRKDEDNLVVERFRNLPVIYRNDPIIFFRQYSELKIEHARYSTVEWFLKQEHKLWLKVRSDYCGKLNSSGSIPIYPIMAVVGMHKASFEALFTADFTEWLNEVLPSKQDLVKSLSTMRHPEIKPP